MSNSADNLRSLGAGATAYPTTYDPSVLEWFPNKSQRLDDGVDFTVELECPEFTALCPKTSQPDFAKIVITYAPDQRCVESKSLKLYLFSFRNHGSFHEEVVNTIGGDLVKLLEPRWLRVRGDFFPRGGISINPEFNYSEG